MTTPNTVDALMAHMRLVEQFKNSGYQEHAECWRAVEASARALAAIPEQQAGGVPGWTAEEIEEVIACLDDDAVTLLDKNSEDERAINMQRAAAMIQVLSQAEPPLSEAQIEAGARSEQFWGRTLGEIYAEGARFAEALHGIVTPKEPTS